MDVLREEYGITPSGVLGHSAGEIACGYGDGCFTREQTVLVAYHRGRMCPEHNISGGLMAAVGLGSDEAEARLAKHSKASCVVGCDNSPNSVTLSGEAHSLSPTSDSLLNEPMLQRIVESAGSLPACGGFAGHVLHDSALVLIFLWVKSPMLRIILGCCRS